MQKTTRRAFIDLAEAVRTLPIESGRKMSLVRGMIDQMYSWPNFSAERFTAHALSSREQTPQWREDERAWYWPDGSLAYRAGDATVG